MPARIAHISDTHLGTRPRTGVRYNVWGEEMRSQLLENDFYEQVAIYMGRKMNLNIKNNSEFSSGRDLEHTKIIIKDILNRRERKVINIATLNARGNVIPKNILPVITPTFLINPLLDTLNFSESIFGLL